MKQTNVEATVEPKRVGVIGTRVSIGGAGVACAECRLQERASEHGSSGGTKEGTFG